MFVWSQLSPCWMVPLCISSLRLGTTKEIVGNALKLPVGKLVKGKLSVGGISEKLNQALCLRAYTALLPVGYTHPVKPTLGILSEYPAKVFSASRTSRP